MNQRLNRRNNNRASNVGIWQKHNKYKSHRKHHTVESEKEGAVTVSSEGMTDSERWLKEHHEERRLAGIRARKLQEEGEQEAVGDYTYQYQQPLPGYNYEGAYNGQNYYAHEPYVYHAEHVSYEGYQPAYDHGNYSSHLAPNDVFFNAVDGSDSGYSSSYSNGYGRGYSNCGGYGRNQSYGYR